MHATTASISQGGEFEAAVEAAKLQALYNFAYGLSHEINNPLANIATRAQTLLVDERDPERRRKLATIVQQAFRAHEMIADLMLFARPPTLRLEATDLSRLCETVVSEMQEQAREQGTQLIHRGTESLIVTVDPTQIAVALKALVQNSLEALKRGGQIEVLSADYSAPGVSAADGPHRSTTRHIGGALTANPQSSIPNPHFRSTPHSAPRTPHFLLSVTDTGPGIPAQIRPHIFDPFFSGREAGRGLGLGLSKAWRIVELHGGLIEVSENDAHGATFTMTIPSESDS